MHLKELPKKDKTYSEKQQGKNTRLWMDSLLSDLHQYILLLVILYILHIMDIDIGVMY